MTSAELKQAFREAASMEFADIPCDEAQIVFNFSDRFLQKMDKLIARQKKPYWGLVNTARKRVAVVAILILSIVMTVFSSEEIRASMLQWCVDVYDTYIYYFFEGETTKEITHEYQLTMVPEGFEVIYDYRDEESITIGYENIEGDYIQFEQHVTEGYDYYVDNENLKWSKIMLDGLEVKLYEHPDMMGAIWIRDGYSMQITYYGCEEIEIITKMINAVE